MEEETDPGLGFAALHRHYALANSYRIKEEPSDNDLLALQELLSWSLYVDKKFFRKRYFALCIDTIRTFHYYQILIFKLYIYKKLENL